MSLISIVIPAYNEAKRLPASLEAVLRYFGEKSQSLEIVVVDDGSTDETARLVSSLAGEHSEIRLLRNEGNRGKGYSVRRGVLEARGDWILFSDADLSAPIAEIEKLEIAARAAKAEGAIGSRALDPSLIVQRQSWLRQGAGRVFNLLMRSLTGLPFSDTQCGFKLFRATAAKDIFARQQIEGFGFDVEVMFLAQRLGYHMIEVPVRWAHVEGSKVQVGRDSMRMFLDLFRIRWYDVIGRYRLTALQQSVATWKQS